MWQTEFDTKVCGVGINRLHDAGTPHVTDSGTVAEQRFILLRQDTK
jgi:hypothetical protein